MQFLKNPTRHFAGVLHLFTMGLSDAQGVIENLVLLSEGVLNMLYHDSRSHRTPSISSKAHDASPGIEDPFSTNQ